MTSLRRRTLLLPHRGVVDRRAVDEHFDLAHRLRRRAGQCAHRAGVEARQRDSLAVHGHAEFVDFERRAVGQCLPLAARFHLDRVVEQAKTCLVCHIARRIEQIVLSRAA